MKRIVVYYAIFAGLSLVSFRPATAFASARDIEEDRLHIERPGCRELGEKLQAGAHMDKEIRYVAGPDKRWFTSDDQVCHFYYKNLDAKGNVIKRSYVLPGKDGIPFTGDDLLQNYQVFDIGPDGKVKQEVSFDAKDRKLHTAVYAYDDAGKKIKVTDYSPRKKIIRETEFRYNDGNQIVQDEEYVGKKLEKYHRFQYDDKGRLWRVVEYHADLNGAGADKKWFTDDDVISSAKEYFYDDKREESKDKKYIGPGPDKKWFTADDELHYYTLEDY